MEFNIVKKRGFKVLGRSISRPIDEVSFEDKHLFRKKCESYHLFERLRTMPACLNPNNLMSIDLKNIEDKTMDFLVCVEVSNFNFVPMDMVIREIPENIYARFEVSGEIDSVVRFWDDLRKNRINLGAYLISEGPSFELREYVNDIEDGEYVDDLVKIYVPVEEKRNL